MLFDQMPPFNIQLLHGKRGQILISEDGDRQLVGFRTDDNKLYVIAWIHKSKEA